MKNQSIPKLSIVVPVYNVAEYLQDCLDSLLAQTNPDFELLLVDDGSTDASGVICDDCRQRDPRIRVIHQPNRGVSVARNRGLDRASGEWISFVDPDDYVEPDYVETLLAECEDAADLTFFGATVFREGALPEKRLPMAARSTDRNSLQAILLWLKHNPEQYEYFGFTWNKLFRTSLIREHGLRFPEGLDLREDEVFTKAYSCHIRSLKVLDRAIYNYRMRVTGLSSRRGSYMQYARLCCELIRLEGEYDYVPLMLWERQHVLNFMYIAVKTAYRNRISHERFLKRFYIFYHRSPLRSMLQLGSLAKMLDKPYGKYRCRLFWNMFRIYGYRRGKKAGI